MLRFLISNPFWGATLIWARRLLKGSSYLNSLNAKVAIIQKPVNWFPKQIYMFLYDGNFGVKWVNMSMRKSGNYWRTTLIWDPTLFRENAVFSTHIITMLDLLSILTGILLTYNLIYRVKLCVVNFKMERSDTLNRILYRHLFRFQSNIYDSCRQQHHLDVTTKLVGIKDITILIC